MNWDPYGMPHTSTEEPEPPDRRLPPQETRVSARTVLAILGGMALLALVFAGVANGQQSETEQQQTQEQKTGDQQTQDQQTQQQAQQPAQAEDDAERKASATPLDGQFVEQPEETYVASTLMGRSVYSAEREAMGQISDLVVTESNRIVGVVIGIGGFLGIGEKPIAVELDRLKRTTNQEGDEQLVLDYTRAELEQAPRFVSLVEQKRRQEAEEARQLQQQGSAATSG